jgi:hypothetical protein
MKRFDLTAVPLRQRDGVTCGPSVAIVGAALLDPGYADEQHRLHRRLNRLWPRALGTTPAATAAALSHHSARGYRWRCARGRGDRLTDVREALLLGYPVAMLVGGIIPRHWVLLVGFDDDGDFRCYEPSSGAVRRVTVADIRSGRLTAVGFPRPFCFVLPGRAW